MAAAPEEKKPAGAYQQCREQAKFHGKQGR